MKKAIISAIILTTITATAFAQPTTGSVQAELASLMKWLNKETNPPSTGNNPNDSPTPPSITNTAYLNQVALTNNPSENKTPTIQHQIKQKNNAILQDNIDNTLTHFLYDAYKNSTKTEGNFKEKNSGESNTNETTPTNIFSFNTSGGPGTYQHYANEYSLSNLINGPEYANRSTLYIDKNWAGKNEITLPSDQQTVILTNQPQKTHNHYLNFSNIISPASYDPAQEQTAQKYILFSTQKTKNLAADLNLNELFPQKKLTSDQAKKFIPAFIGLKKDPNYQKFMMAVNSLIAVRSISLENLQYLVSERTPMKGLGKAAGKKTDSASPLEVEAYQANHRIDDPNWYTTIRNDSPATVQRTIAIELAEIEHQNYQAHLDNERILSALIAQNLNSNNAASAQLKLEAMGANNAIKCAVNTMNGAKCAPTASQ